MCYIWLIWMPRKAGADELGAFEKNRQIVFELRLFPDETYTHRHTHTHTHTHTYTQTQTHTHTDTHTHRHTYIHTHTHIHTHTYIHTHTDTHTHTHSSPVKEGGEIGSMLKEEEQHETDGARLSLSLSLSVCLSVCLCTAERHGLSASLRRGETAWRSSGFCLCLRWCVRCPSLRLCTGGKVRQDRRHCLHHITHFQSTRFCLNASNELCRHV